MSGHSDEATLQRQLEEERERADSLQAKLDLFVEGFEKMQSGEIHMEAFSSLQSFPDDHSLEEENARLREQLELANETIAEASSRHKREIEQLTELSCEGDEAMRASVGELAELRLKLNSAEKEIRITKERYEEEAKDLTSCQAELETTKASLSECKVTLAKTRSEEVEARQEVKQIEMLLIESVDQSEALQARIQVLSSQAAEVEKNLRAEIDAKATTHVSFNSAEYDRARAAIVQALGEYGENVSNFGIELDKSIKKIADLPLSRVVSIILRAGVSLKGKCDAYEKQRTNKNQLLLNCMAAMMQCIKAGGWKYIPASGETFDPLRIMSHLKNLIETHLKKTQPPVAVAVAPPVERIEGFYLGSTRISKPRPSEKVLWDAIDKTYNNAPADPETLSIGAVIGGPNKNCRIIHGMTHTGETRVSQSLSTVITVAHVNRSVVYVVWTRPVPTEERQFWVHVFKLANKTTAETLSHQLIKQCEVSS